MLRILSRQTNDPTINGLMSAFAVAGNNCLYVNKNKAIYDALYEFQPDFILCYANDYVDQIEEASKTIKTTVVVLKANILKDNTLGWTPKPAANIAQYSKGSKQKKWQAELSYISLSVPTSPALNFVESFLWPNYQSKYLKLYGEPIPFPAYLGKVSMGDITNILKSSTCLLNYHNDLLLEAWYNGCVAVPYKSNPLLYPDIFGRAETPDEMKDRLEEFTGNDKKLASAKEWVLDGNTYFHRAAELLTVAGYYAESESCLATFNALNL